MALIELAFIQKQRRHTALGHSYVLYPKRPDLFTVTALRLFPFGSSDYGRFNCNNMGANSQSWNYRSCWHQTGPLLGYN